MSSTETITPADASRLTQPASATLQAARSYPPLNAFDRCEATTRTGVNKSMLTCAAQAIVRVILPSGLDLVFCGHCVGEQKGGTGEARSRRESLQAAGAVFVSQYGEINVKPDPQAEKAAGGF